MQVDDDCIFKFLLRSKVEQKLTTTTDHAVNRQLRAICERLGVHYAEDENRYNLAVLTGVTTAVLSQLMYLEKCLASQHSEKDI